MASPPLREREGTGQETSRDGYQMATWSFWVALITRSRSAGFASSSVRWKTPLPSIRASQVPLPERVMTATEANDSSATWYHRARRGSPWKSFVTISKPMFPTSLILSSSGQESMIETILSLIET